MLSSGALAYQGGGGRDWALSVSGHCGGLRDLTGSAWEISQKSWAWESTNHKKSLVLVNTCGGNSQVQMETVCV